MLKKLTEWTKALRDAWKFLKLIKRTPGVVGLAQSLLDFLNDTSRSNRPMMCKLAMVDTRTKKEKGTMLHIWAGVPGHDEPYDRLQTLAQRWGRSKELLERIEQMDGIDKDTRDDIADLLTSSNP